MAAPAEEIHQMALDSDDSDSDNWLDEDDDIEEESEENQPTKCLFCESTFAGAEATLQHCRSEHQFDIRYMAETFSLDCFGYIKMINYIRNHHPSSETLSQASPADVPWSSDDYMRPELEDDPLLQFDVEEMDEMNVANGSAGGGDDTTTDRQEVRLSGAEYRALQQRLHDAESRAKQAEERMQELLNDLAGMRDVAQNLVLASGPEPAPSHRAVQSLQEDDDDVYFGSYSHFSIHQEMLQDKVRTESYRDSIMRNPEVFKDKVVLDVGCGTGILSMFAARAGARRVIGIDMSDILYQAMDIVRENKLENIVTLIKGRVEDVDLPVEQVDIIISEWMGYFLLFESMLDTVLYARDRWLSPGGKILPNRCNISLAGIGDENLHKQQVSYWNDVYGFRMNCMKSAVVQEASVQVVKPEAIITDACVIKDIDICECSTKDLEFTSPFKLTASNSGQLVGLVGYFDIWFQCLPNSVFFSTSPSSIPTHWKQTVFMLESPISIEKGEIIEGQLVCRKNRKDPRSLKVTLSMRNKIYTFHMQ